MSRRLPALAIAVRPTVFFLLSGAFLVVLGIFNEYLDWDIFSPEVERLLWGIFASCLALGGFGVAISVVLGIREVVFALRRLIASTDQPEAPVTDQPSMGKHLSYVVWLAAFLAAVIGSLSLVNRRIEARRIHVFKAVVRDQMQRLAPRLAREIPKQTPCATCTAPAVAQLLKALVEQPFCQQLALVIADPEDEAFLWRFAPRARPDGSPATFERFFIANDGDRAVQRALAGDTTLVDEINGRNAFRWIDVIRDGQRRPVAALRIRGNPHESFRDYQTVMQVP